MTNSAESRATAKAKIGQIFRYLEALNQLRNPVIRRLDDQPWKYYLRSLPSHSSIERMPVVDAAPPIEEGEPTNLKDDNFLLRVRRPTFTPCPPPPDPLQAWLEYGW